MFVVDVSGSIEERNFRKIIQFIINITSRMDIDNGVVRIGALTFSDASLPQVLIALQMHSGAFFVIVFNTLQSMVCTMLMMLMF